MPQSGSAWVNTLLSTTAFVLLQAARPQAAAVAELPVLPNAVDVVRDPKTTTPSVAYDIRETYPAPQTIRALVDAMAKAGWRLAEVSGFRGSWPQPSDFPSPPGPRRDGPTHVWQGRWLGAGGREAVFRLTYTCPMEDAGMHSVWVQVSGVVSDPKDAAVRNAARRRLLQECEAGGTVRPECEH
jgi:hypothetical protein